MDAQKILSVLDIYIQELPKFNVDGIHVKAERLRPELMTKRFVIKHSENWMAKLNHVLFCCEQTKAFVAEGRMEKAFRWLGFIQGALWYEGVYSIEELASHNMPPGEEISHSLEKRS